MIGDRLQAPLFTLIICRSARIADERAKPQPFTGVSRRTLDAEIDVDTGIR